MGPAIGIDLGTCYSCVGTFKDGAVEIIPNSYGKRVSPSYVAFRGNERLLGESALDQAAYNSENTVFEAKRLIGRNFEDETVQADIRNFPFKVVKEGERIKIQMEHHGGKRKTFFPEEISSFVLSHMKDIAERHLESKVEDAVITVPAYFNQAQRQATKDAGEIAGLNVLRIINEPTAAAIAYGLTSFSQMEKAKNVLVFDLGGGTFDVSLLSMQHEIEDEGEIEVLAVDGNAHLGGVDFTNKLVNYMQHVVKATHGKDISSDKRATRRLYNACEKAKIRLSTHTEANIELDALVPNVDFYTTITRDKFEELSESLFAKVIRPLEDVLKEAKLQKAELDEVVLVGGSTRIPMIQQKVSTFFNNKKLNKSINPDEAVACGATIQAAILNGETDLDMTLLDVIPMTLGWMDGRDGRLVKMLKKNTKIPSQHSVLSEAEVSGNNCKISVFEGERHLAKENILLGKVKVNTRRGKVSQWKIHFEVDTNGILTASIQDQLTNNVAVKQMERSSTSLTKKDIQRIQKNAKVYKEDDLKETSRLSKKNKLLSECVNIRYNMRMDERFAMISESEKTKMEKKCQTVTEWVKENSEAAIGVFEDKERELLEHWTAVSKQANTRSSDLGKFRISKFLSPTVSPAQIVSDEKRWWKDNESNKTSDQYEAEANQLCERGGKTNYEKAFMLYGKAKSAAEAKGLMGKIPALLLRMASCLQNTKEDHRDPFRQRQAVFRSSYHIHLAVHTSISGGTECSQSQEWTIRAVKEALEAATGFFNECLPKIEDKTQRLREAGKFSLNTCEVRIQGHPFQDVTILIHKEIAFLAFELASEFLKMKDYQAGRQHLQTMLKSIDKVKDSHGLREKEDEEVTKELKALMEDYLVSCDIAQALEGVEAGNLIYSLAKKDLESSNVECALNKGWDALDKFNEVESLSQSIMDDVFLQAKAGKGFIYCDVFKMPEKAKKIFTSVVERSLHKDCDWYQAAEERLKAMAANDPGSLILHGPTTVVR